MRIYAIRDRLIDYFMPPFAAPGEKEVMQSLAATVNNTQEATNAIAQAPHHFELYELGHVTEDGHIAPERRFICDCSALVRGNIRRPGVAGDPTAEVAPESRRGPYGGPESRSHANDSPVPGSAPPAHLAGR